MGSVQQSHALLQSHRLFGLGHAALGWRWHQIRTPVVSSRCLGGVTGRVGGLRLCSTDQAGGASGRVAAETITRGGTGRAILGHGFMVLARNQERQQRDKLDRVGTKYLQRICIIMPMQPPIPTKCTRKELVETY